MDWSAEHRPWALPDRPWVVAMTWSKLLFAHWPIDASKLEPFIPDGLELDRFDGKAWLGVVPFDMLIRPRWTPVLPGLSRFAEINLRTYVTCEGKPGVWFFSLDAANVIAVAMARWKFNLPYFRAKMSCEAGEDGAGENGSGRRIVRYTSRRTHRGYPPAEFDASYQPTGGVFHAASGSIEYFLTERYCLYAADKGGRLFRGEIHHAPWPLQVAAWDRRTCDMGRLVDVAFDDEPALLHYVDRIDVRAWLNQPISSG